MPDETEPSLRIVRDGLQADLGDHVAHLDPADALATTYFQQHLIHQRWLRRGLAEIDRLLAAGYDRSELAWFLSRREIPEPIQISGSRLYDVQVVRVPIGPFVPAVGIDLERPR